MRTFHRAVSVSAICLAVSPLSAQIQVDSRLPSYKSVAGVSGTVKSVGSDTLSNLVTLWAEKFNRYYPNVKLEIEGKGSSTAPPALIAGTSSFAPMSRPMMDKEVDAFERQFGYKPEGLRIAIDMVAIYVHRDNPISERGLSLRELDAIFSSTRLGGAPEDIRTWGDLGLNNSWTRIPISLYGRNSASGTYGYFKEHALFRGDFKNSVKEQPGSSSVVQGVARDRAGIGYSGIGYQTADVVAVPLTRRPDGPYTAATPQTVGKYPLARFLLVYVNKEPGKKLDPVRREVVKFIFSKDGQEIVIKDGYLPVSYEIAKDTLIDVGIDIETDY